MYLFFDDLFLLMLFPSILTFSRAFSIHSARKFGSLMFSRRVFFKLGSLVPGTVGGGPDSAACSP
jgi:hypothetical protein